MNKTQYESNDFIPLLNAIAQTMQKTKQQLALYPESKGNQEAAQTLKTVKQTLVNINNVSQKNLEDLKTHNRLENLNKRCNAWESNIGDLSAAAVLSRSFRQINILKKILTTINESIAQLKSRDRVKAESGEEKKCISAVEETCAKVSFNLNEKFKQLQISKVVDICIHFTVENIGENDGFAICGEANGKDLFTYQDPIVGPSGLSIDLEKCNIPVHWQNNIPSARIHREFEVLQNASHACINPKVLPFPKIFLRLCCESEELKTVSFKVAKITQDGKKFWMEGNNITKNIQDAIVLSNFELGFDLGVVKFENTSAN